MKLPNLLPNWISNRVADPEGTAPKGLVFKIGVILLALLMAVVIFLAPSEESSSGQTAAAPSLPPPAGPSAVTRGDQDIQSAADRRAAEQSRAERRKRETVNRARQIEERFMREQAELEAEAADNREAIAAARQQDLTAEEELYQNIRLQKIQREDTSLRSAPVALSFRSAETQARPLLVEPTAAPPPTTAPQPLAPAQPAAQPPATRAEQALEESDLVAATQRPASARGWERIEGGQWIEAVLVTQIRGDAPGPAIARASTPFWSRDRQRILIPRGARFVGRVQAVQGINQSRLSVTFDRLIYDNYNIRMPFGGLSQAGEAGLKDKVKRHYLSTFGAAGAVGVISGLTLRNTQSAGFNVPAGQAARMEAGRSLGESTSAIMNRYLNRLPTIIIRAGHRIRIYFVSDLLVPRRPA